MNKILKIGVDIDSTTAKSVAIDYDPGASHTNQVNRIKLMLTVAKEKQEKDKYSPFPFSLLKIKNNMLK